MKKTKIDNDLMESQEPFIESICQLMKEGQLHSFKEELDKLARMSEDYAATVLMRSFLRYYRPQKADFIACWMEQAIRYNVQWALVGGIDNPLLRAAFVSGSKDLYDCYIEEVPDLTTDWYNEIIQLAFAYNQHLLESCEPVLIGCHYNTGLIQNGRRIIDLDDYEVMDSTIVKYNQIVGMRQILTDILQKAKKG